MAQTRRLADGEELRGSMYWSQLIALSQTGPLAYPFWGYLWGLAARLVPMLLLAVFLAELARLALGGERLRRTLIGKRPWEGRARAAALGAVLPFCECGAFPIMVALLRAGVPLGPVLTFFMVSPVLSLPTFTVMAGVLSLRLAIAYLILAVIGAMTAAYLLERLLGEERILRLLPASDSTMSCSCTIDSTDSTVTASACCSSGGEPAAHHHSHCRHDEELAGERSLAALFGQAWVPTRATLLRILPYSAAAMLLAASIRTWIPVEVLGELLVQGGRYGVLLAAVAGIPLYMGCTTAVSLSTPLMQATGAVGPGVAFIIAGAGTSISGLVFMAAIFTRRFIALFVATVFLIALICGFVLAALPWG